jgi:dolichol-phosphate mannosyltransferase
MYERLKATFTRMNIDFEIIFVNDSSPDDTEEVIRSLSNNDRRVLGISHSRNFGSQAAFRSGMEVASKNACVLLAGNLHDPPETIEQFVAHWRQGYDVVYGIRIIDRKGGLHWATNKAFYLVFNYFSSIRIPHNAGDYSLIDKRVVEAILRFPERDLFLRGLRACAGFKQVGVWFRPEPGVVARRSESLARRFRRAKHGIFSFSNVPLSIMTYIGFGMLMLSIVLSLLQVVIRIAYPRSSVTGITTVLLVVLFFGALNAFSVGLIGEYIGRIFEEVKRRPHFIRRAFIKNGEIRHATDNALPTES